MPDFRIADTAPDHRKLRAAGLTAVGLWSMAGAFAMRELTDGWVPTYFVQGWPGGAKSARALIKVGLWWEEERDGMPGYRFHDFLDFQRAAARITREREEAKARMQALRNGSKKDRPEASGNGRSSPPVRPNNRRTNGEHAGEVPPKFGDSLPPSPGGYVEGESSGGETRAHETPPPPNSLISGNRPQERCGQHVDQDTDPGPCWACGDARRAAERWDDAQRRATAEQASAAARERAELRARAVAECGMCDEHGRLPGGAVCDHDPGRADRAKRGAAMVRAAMNPRPDTGSTS